MKYSPYPTLMGATILFVAQFFETGKVVTNSTIYFIGIIILAVISITISTANNNYETTNKTN